MQIRNIIIGLFVIVAMSCTTESESTLKNKLDNEDYDFSKLDKESGNVKYAKRDGIQYGIILLENNDKIKFWFLTHHLTNDKGGTIYEFPNGEIQFYSGFHCCEVQFFENGIEPIKFSDSKEFKEYVEKYNGVRP